MADDLAVAQRMERRSAESDRSRVAERKRFAVDVIAVARDARRRSVRRRSSKTAARTALAETRRRRRAALAARRNARARRRIAARAACDGVSRHRRQTCRSARSARMGRRCGALRARSRIRRCAAPSSGLHRARQFRAAPFRRVAGTVRRNDASAATAQRAAVRPDRQHAHDAPHLQGISRRHPARFPRRCDFRFIADRTQPRRATHRIADDPLRPRFLSDVAAAASQSRRSPRSRSTPRF